VVQQHLFYAKKNIIARTFLYFFIAKQYKFIYLYFQYLFQI